MRVGQFFVCFSCGREPNFISINGQWKSFSFQHFQKSMERSRSFYSKTELSKYIRSRFWVSFFSALEIFVHNFDNKKEINLQTLSSYMPLLRSNLRLDPVLYRDSVSNLRKKYRQIELVLS